MVPTNSSHAQLEETIRNKTQWYVHEQPEQAVGHSEDIRIQTSVYRNLFANIVAHVQVVAIANGTITFWRYVFVAGMSLPR